MSNMPPPPSDRFSLAFASAKSGRMSEASRKSVAAGYKPHPSLNFKASLGKASINRASSIATGVGSLSGRVTVASAVANRVPNFTKVAGIKDTRNISDKGVVSAMATKLFNFLKSRDAPFPYTEVTVRKPNGKTDFKNMFDFIIKQMDEKFIFGTKPIEEEVPKILAAFGYPFPLKKSSLQSIAPHSWPQCLAALDWMIDIIEKSANNEAIIDDNQHLAFSYFFTTYKQCLEEGINPLSQEKDSSRFRVLFNRYKEALFNSAKIDDEMIRYETGRKENERMLYEVRTEIEKDEEEIKVLEEKVADKEIDIGKLQTYVEEFLIMISRTEENIVSIEAAMEQNNEALEKVEAENQEKESRVAAQSMGGDEFRSMISRLNVLKDQKRHDLQELRKAEKQVYEKEPLKTKQENELRKDYFKFCNTLRRLADLLETGKSIDWSRYEYDFSNEEDMNRSREEVPSLMDSLQSQLKEIVAVCSQKNSELDCTIETRKQTLRDIEDQKAKAILENNIAAERTERDNEDVVRQVKAQEKEVEMVKFKHEAAKNDLQQSNDRTDAVQTKLVDVEKQYNDEKSKLDKMFSDIMAMTFESAGKLYTHFNTLIKRKTELKQLADDILEANKSELEVLRQKIAEKEQGKSNK